MMKTSVTVLLGSCLALAACNAPDPAAEEAAALNNAAETLDASPDSLAAPEGAPVDGANDTAAFSNEERRNTFEPMCA